MKITDEQIEKHITKHFMACKKDLFIIMKRFVNEVVNAEPSEPYSIGDEFPLDIEGIEDCKMRVVDKNRDKTKHGHEWFYANIDKEWYYAKDSDYYAGNRYKSIPIDARYWVGDIKGIKVRAYEHSNGNVCIVPSIHKSSTDNRRWFYTYDPLDKSLLNIITEKANIKVMPWSVHEALGLKGFPTPEE